MKKMTVLLLTFLLGWMAGLLGQVEPFGLQGRNITALAYVPASVDPFRKLLTAAADSGGVYFYDFASASPAWFSAGLSGKLITALAIQHRGIGPLEANAVYAAIKPGSAAGDSVMLYLQDPTLTVPWTPADSGLAFAAGDSIRALSALHYYGQTAPRPVFAVSPGRIFPYYPDSGWEAVWPFGRTVSLYIIRSFQSGAGAVSWAGGETGFFQPLLVKSGDDGGNWTGYFPGLGGDNRIYSVSVDIHHPDTVYAGARGQVVKTTDGGQSWFSTDMPDIQAVIRGLVMDPANPQHLLAGGSSPGNSFVLFESYSGGADWIEVQTFSPLPGVADMAADTLNGEFVAYIATAGDGVYRYRAPLLSLETTGGENLPSGFGLEGNYPNPFNSATVIDFRLTARAQVLLEIYTVNGAKTATVLNQPRPAGRHSIRWDAGNRASGIYFLRAAVNGRTMAVRKLFLMK